MCFSDKVGNENKVGLILDPYFIKKKKVRCST